MLLIIAYFFFFILGKLEHGLFDFVDQLYRKNLLSTVSNTLLLLSIFGKLKPGLFGFLEQLHREKKIRKFYFSRGYRFLQKKLQFMVQRKWLYKNTDKISSWQKSSQKIGNIYNDECYKTNQRG